ncbi:MAG TPA: hypothetical protein VLG37_00990 [Candidatus Saccharimonadales bacterium]|nr:hypothetical protein [Candidatus Saccharimonadales bacterium]
MEDNNEMPPNHDYSNPGLPELPDWPAPAEEPKPADLHHQSHHEVKDVNPMAVVQVLSTRGVEYTMLTLCLWLVAIAFGWVGLALVNGDMHFNILAFPAALLVVALPIFAWLFLRQKRAELMNPMLKLDPSKRRLTQLTQIVTFAICLFNVIGFVFLVFSKLAGQGGPVLWKSFLNLLVVLVVAGGILAYYWNDEHRGR